MKDALFGFGFEMIGAALYLFAWAWISTLLEEKFKCFKGRIITCSVIALLVLHFFVVSYLVLIFWSLVITVGVTIWNNSIETWVEKKTPWINRFNKFAIRVVILIIAFVLLRNGIFHWDPEKIWYTNLLG